MAKQYWIKTDKLPESVQRMCDAFEASFGPGLHNKKITYWRGDALFIQHYGILNAYAVARFCQQNQDIYIEIEAIAPGYFNIRLFDSTGMQINETERMQKFLNAPAYEPMTHPYSIRSKQPLSS